MLLRLLTLILFLLSSPLQAFEDLKEGGLIRDSEIERILKSYIHPLFQAAGLNPKDLNLYIVATREVNAAAANNHIMLINTGIILKMTSASQLVGVLAHETSHISGGHVTRIHDVIGKTTLANIISLILAGATAVISGNPEAGIAVMMGGQHFAMANLFRYTQGQEGAADQGAIKLLEKLGWSSRGLSEFLSVLMQKEILSVERQDAYMRTHPLTRDRVESIQNHMTHSQYTEVSLPEEFEDNFKLMQAKVKAFTDPVGRLLLNNKESDSDPLTHYVRAIAHFRRADHALALQEIEGLISQKPENPFYWELKGQILFDVGKIQEAEQAYSKAVALAPQEPLLRLLWAQALIETNDPQNIEKAKVELLRAKTDEATNPFTWRLLAIVHGKANQLGDVALCLAEQNFFVGNFGGAIQQAKRAQKIFKKDSLEYIRAQDIIEDAQEMMGRG